MPESQASPAAPGPGSTPLSNGRRLPHPQRRLLRSQSLPVTSGRWAACTRGETATQTPAQGDLADGLEVLGDAGSAVSGGVFSDMLGPMPSEILPESNSKPKKRPQAARDTRATIMQHYYPEGGWGWVIVGVATAVHILTHGLHTGYGAILGITVAKFSQQATLVGRCTASRAREQQATPAQAARSGCQGRGRGRGSPSRRRAEGERFGSFGHEAECEGNVCVGKHAEEKPERVTMNSPRKHATPLRIGAFIVRVSSSNIKIMLT